MTPEFLNRYKIPVATVFVFAMSLIPVYGQKTAETEKRSVREIFVPETELGVLLEGAADRILLKRNEFEELLEKSRKIRMQTEKTPDRTPAEAVLISSEYEIRILGQRALIEGRLEIDLLTEDPVAIPLPLDRVSVLEARWTDENKPAPIGVGADSVRQLILQGKKRHRLDLRLTTSLEVDSTRQGLRFRVPRSTQTSLKLTVPGDVEMKSGAAVLSRKVEEGKTDFELLPPPGDGPIELLMTLNSHRAGTYKAVLARSVQFAEVTEQYERLHATVSLNELHQGIREISFSIPQGFEMTDVHSIFLDRWNVQKADQAEKSDVMTVRFREQVPGLTTVYLSAIKTKSPVDSQGAATWNFPLFRPRDVAGDSSVLGLLLEKELDISNIKSRRLFPIDTMTLKDAIPPSALDAVPGSPELRLALAWYAPNEDGEISAGFRRPAPDCGVDMSQVVSLSEKEPTVAVQARLTPKSGKVFETVLHVPENWKVLHVFDAGGRSVKFQPRGQGKILIRYPRGIAPGETLTLNFNAVGTAENWFRENSNKKLTCPVFRVEGSTDQHGKIFVRNSHEEDWDIIALKTENLTSSDESVKTRPDSGAKNALRFQYASTPYTLELGLEKLSSRSKAKTFSFYRFQPKLLQVRHELEFSVEQASARKLAFLMPIDSPPTPTIRGIGNLTIKESFSEEVERENEKFRRWEVHFLRPMSGTLRIGVDFEQPISVDESESAFELPRVFAEDVAWQSGYVAVEGDEELDLTIPTEASGKSILRPVDVGVVASAAYKPGRRLLGVFSVADQVSGTKTAPVVEIRKNTTFDLVAAMIRSVHVTARLEGGPQKSVLYSIRYEIKTGGASVKAELDPAAEIWSVALDGQTIKPQRVENEILIPIPAKADTEIRQLVFLYRSKNPDDSKLRFPSLTLAGKAEATPIPVMQTVWNVVPPDGYEVVQLGESGSAKQLQEPALFRLFKGGVGAFAVLTYRPNIRDYGIPFPSVRGFGCSAAREAARKSSIAVPVSPYFQGGYEDGEATGEIAIFDALPVECNLDVLEEEDSSDKKDALEKFEEKRPAERSKPEADLFKARRSDAGGKMQGKTVARGRRLQSAQPVTVVVTARDSVGMSGFGAIGNRSAQEISVRIANISTGNRVLWAATLIVWLVGLAGIKRSRKSKALFVFGILALCTILSFIPCCECFRPIFDGAVYGAALTALFYIGAALFHRLGIGKRTEVAEPAVPGESAPSGVPVAGMILAGLILFGISSSASRTVFAADDPANDSKTLPKIQLPADAIVVPYSMADVAPNKLPDARSLTRPEQSILVPLRQYTGILERIRARELSATNIPKALLPYAISSVEYSATVRPDVGDDLPLRGTLQIDVFSDKAVLVPFDLENGVMVDPKLDGRPASIRAISETQSAILVSGTGRHELSFDVRVKVQRQGGWRIVSGKLPTASTSKVVLTLPEEASDLLTGNPLDQRKWASGRQREIETSLEPGGVFRWQWRSVISEAGVDRNLEVESVVRCDLQEDASWIHWTPTFKISRGRWDMLRLRLPKDYVIAEIVGENVRGWSVDSRAPNAAANDATKTGVHQDIDVELLKPAEKSETISIRLMKSAAEDGRWSLPKLSVPDAGIHRGRIDLYRVVNRSLRVSDLKSLSLTDTVSGTPAANPRAALQFDATSPLGLSVYQSYRFVSENYAMNVESKAIQKYKSVRFDSVLKITRQETVLETKITIPGYDEPFSGVVELPKKYTLRNVRVPEGISWNLEKRESGGDLLHISYGNAVSGSIDVLLEGDFSAARSEDGTTIESLPGFALKTQGEADRDHDQNIAVLTESSIDVRAADLVRCRTESPDSAFSWIQTPEQRELVRLALDASKEFSGRLVLSERKPEVRCSTISNVRTTADAIEETVLLDFQISRAGIRNVEFLLPEWMKDAKIDAPFLKRKTILDSKDIDSEDVDSEGVYLKKIKTESPFVLVRLELQEDVMDQFRVLVRSDRRLQPETDYKVFAPKISTGQTTRQYVVMENDRHSQDEMVVDPARIENLRALSRQQREWAYLASILGNNVTEAYYATPSEENDGFGTLSFRMRRRETVRLADARIDLAETRLVLGENGVYRAEQIYRIDNKKEPYLDILLPGDATIWGARILSADQWKRKDQGEKGDWGQPVKPCLMPADVAAKYPKAKGKPDTNLVRIPLVKTETGDLDYVVRLVYAGELKKFRWTSRFDMPFIEVLNIPVGESLVRVYLPENQDYRFDGNLEQVRQGRETEVVRQAETNYFRKQTDRLQQAAQSSNLFVQKRARKNLARNDNDYRSYSGGNIDGRGELTKTGSGTLELSGQNQYSGGTQVQAGRAAVQDGPAYQVEVVNEGKPLDEIGFYSNSGALESNYMSQMNRSSNVVVSQKSLKAEPSRTTPGGTTRHSGSGSVVNKNFDANWLSSGNLTNDIQSHSAALELTDDTTQSDESSEKDGDFENSERPASGRAMGQSGPGRMGRPGQVARRNAPPIPPGAEPQMIPQSQRDVVVEGGGQIVLGRSLQSQKRGYPTAAGPTSADPFGGPAKPGSPLTPVPASAPAKQQDAGSFNSGSLGFEGLSSTDSTRGGGMGGGMGGGASADFSEIVELIEAVTLDDKNEFGKEFSQQDNLLFDRQSGENLSRSSSAWSFNGYGVSGGEAPQGFQGSLEVVSETPFTPNTATGSGGSIYMGGSVVGGVPMEPAPESSVVVRNRNAELAGTIENLGRLELRSPDSDEDVVRQNQQLLYNSEELRLENPVSGARGLSTRTASLDIEIPHEGRMFVFTTPQGSPDLSLRNVSRELRSRGLMIGATILGLAILYGIYRLCLTVASRLEKGSCFEFRTLRRIAVLVTVLAVLTLPIAPVIFLLLILVAAVLWSSLVCRMERNAE